MNNMETLLWTIGLIIAFIVVGFAFAIFWGLGVVMLIIVGGIMKAIINNVY